MRRTNQRMNNILEQIDNEKSEIITIRPKALQELFFPNTKMVHDCLIIDNRDEVVPETINYERVISMYGDQVGYEASCNEVRISDYVDKAEKIDEVRVALLVIQAWKYKLKNEYPDKYFCINLGCNNEHTTLRFHTYRDNKETWLAEDLEGYLEEAILEEIF